MQEAFDFAKALQEAGSYAINALLIIAVIVLYRERNHYLGIVLDTIPKNTAALKRLRRLVIGERRADNEEEVEEQGE